MKRTLRTLLALVLILGLAMGLTSIAQAKTATRITMSRHSLSMDWGTQYTLAVTVTPTNASDKNLIEWESSDNSRVTVTPVPGNPRKAVVKVCDPLASYPDPATPFEFITARLTTSGKTSICAIFVKPIPVKSISVSPSSATVYLTKSQPTYTDLKVSFNPSVAGDQVSYTWSTSNDQVATVDADGVVTFTGEGTALITAAYKSGTVIASDYCRFVVKPVRVKSISLNATVHYMGQGDDFQLNPTVVSAVGGKLPSYPKVTWTSADESIAKVNEDGKVTAQSKSGIVKITASVDKAPYTKSASCLIYVRDDSPTRVTITAGGDCVLGGDPRTTGITARSTQRNYEKLIAANGQAYPFERIARLFAPTGPTGATNLGIVNLEVCLTTKGGSNPQTDRKFLFRGNPKNAMALTEAGITIANIANNHTADFGLSSFTNTASSVKNNSTAEPSGYNRYIGEPYVPVKTVDGKKIGFYGFQANQMPLSMLESRIKKIKSDNHLDMLVVTIHWTGQQEYVRPVSSAMKAYARKAIDSGADLVIGHHRHKVSGIEYYRGKYIIYDMGNFVTGGGDSPYTYAVQVDFDISGNFTESAADTIRIYPLFTTSDALYTWNSKNKAYNVKQSNNWQPVPEDEAIDHYDKDNLNAPVPDLTVAAQVRAIINENSPNGPDGRFDATPYLRNYSTLTR